MQRKHLHSTLSFLFISLRLPCRDLLGLNHHPFQAYGSDNK
jgi:hypothetical protein